VALRIYGLFLLLRGAFGVRCIGLPGWWVRLEALVGLRSAAWDGRLGATARTSGSEALPLTPLGRTRFARTAIFSFLAVVFWSALRWAAGVVGSLGVAVAELTGVRAGWWFRRWWRGAWAVKVVGSGLGGARVGPPP